MKVLASSVIRSTTRGDSHGGLYVVDLEKKTSEQVLDWNYEKIRWEGKGGDRGLRGLIFHDGLLYAAGANELFVFKDFVLVDQFTNVNLDGTHELAIYQDRIYNISNCFDAILVFDLRTKRWVNCIQHVKGDVPRFYDPNVHLLRHSDTMHLDSIRVIEGWIWYAGSTTEHLYGVNEETGKLVAIKLVHPNTHNAQFWKNGIVFNRSLEGDTTYQVGDRIAQKWPTPRRDRSTMTNANIPNDHARSEYTRGMVVAEDSIVVGTSPATIHQFVLGRTEPVASVQITNDMRNSICGMTKYED
jgi:hypothetical protein